MLGYLLHTYYSMYLGGCIQGVLGGGLRYSICISQKTLWLKLVEKMLSVIATLTICTFKLTQ